VHKRAVQRNRIKRQVRTAFRIARGRLPPLDLLIIARTAAVTAGSAALAADLAALFQRLDALKLPPPPGTMLG
jgi:ribonuclease P protein component